jgi:hypothetical protein
MIPPDEPAPTREELRTASLTQNPAFYRKPHLKIRSDAEIWIMSLSSGMVVFLGTLALQWIIYDRFLHEDGLRLVGSVISDYRVTSAGEYCADEPSYSQRTANDCVLLGKL